MIDQPSEDRHEEDLRGALTSEESEAADGTGAEGEEDAEVQDYQLARALDLLRGLALFQERALN